MHHPRRLPNATVLDVIQEVDEEAEEEANDQLGCTKRLGVQEEDRLMDVRTMVFGMGASGNLRVGWVYFCLLSFGMLIHVYDFSGTNMCLTC